MTQPILPQEVLDTKKNLNDKSPGTDGFPGQFYKCLHRLCKYLTVVWGLTQIMGHQAIISFTQGRKISNFM